MHDLRITLQRHGKLAGLCRAVVAMSPDLLSRELVTDAGPTHEAFELVTDESLAEPERTLLRTALDVWNGSGAATVADLATLGRAELKRVAEVLAILASGDAGDAAAYLEELAFRSEGPTVRARPLPPERS